MGQGASKPPERLMTRSERQDELLKTCPLPARIIRRPNRNPDGSEIPSLPGSDFEFPTRDCVTWIRLLRQAMKQNQDQDVRHHRRMVWDRCGIEVNLSATLPTKS